MFMSNSKEPINVVHPQELASQSMLNCVLLIEIVSNSLSEIKKNFRHLTNQGTF